MSYQWDLQVCAFVSEAIFQWEGAIGMHVCVQEDSCSRFPQEVLCPPTATVVFCLTDGRTIFALSRDLQRESVV